MCATARSNAQWSLATLAEMARKSSPLHRIDLRQRFQWNCCVLSGEIKIAGHQQGRMYICNYMYTCIIYNYIYITYIYIYVCVRIMLHESRGIDRSSHVKTCDPLWKSTVGTGIIWESTRTCDFG